MLQITNIQRIVFKEKQIERFVSEMIIILKNSFGELVTENDKELFELIFNWFNESIEFNFKFESDIVDYIRLCYAVSYIGIKEKPELVRNILKNEIYEPSMKIRKLIDIALKKTNNINRTILNKYYNSDVIV